MEPEKGFKRINVSHPPQKKYGFQAKARIFLSGLAVGIILSLAIGLYYYFNLPKSQATEAQKWAMEHPKQLEWAKNRWDKFMKVTEDTYFRNDDLLVDSPRLGETGQSKN